MKHRKKSRIIGRERSQRLSLWRGLTHDLLVHRSLVTTGARAKELRRYFEPLVTKAKQSLTLEARRQLGRAVRETSDVRLLEALAKNQGSRPGGYLRLTHLPARPADNARMVRVKIIEESQETS